MCCKAINLPYSYREITKLGRSGEGDNDAKFIVDNWIPISKRRAKKINPYLVKRNEHNIKLTFWQCKQLTDSGCGVYDTRPDVCRNYPMYTREADYLSQFIPEYHPECTEWPKKIEVVNL